MKGFMPGAMDDDWRRRRAAALEEEERRRRGGAGGGGGSGSASSGKGGSRSGSLVFYKRSAKEHAGSSAPKTSPRPVVERLKSVAAGSQPAVAKVASYGGGVRFGAMAEYVSRGGEIALENQDGERLQSREDIARLREEWSPLFQNRSDSRDIAGFRVEIEAEPPETEADVHALISGALKSGLGDRRFAYGITQRSFGRFEVSGVVVLRAPNGERLTGDEVASRHIKSRMSADPAGEGVAAFRFTGFGNGVDYGTSRLRFLTKTHGGKVRDERGRTIRSEDAAADLVQKDWRRHLHSRTGRDVMHVILSARAGTNSDAFEAASREFLAEQFQGFKYVFSKHDPSEDPKDQHEGGKRPHIHIHALVVMRNEDGDRITTSPQVFRQWRERLAEKAREQGIAMEMTDRREMATAPAFRQTQVRAVDHAGQTRHVGTSDAAQARYDAKRAETPTIATSDRSLSYAFETKDAWRQIAAEVDDEKIANFARDKEQRLTAAIRDTEKGVVASVLRGEFTQQFQTALRQVAKAIHDGNTISDGNAERFAIYETKVEEALSRLETTIEDPERERFLKIAEAARSAVDAQRELLSLQAELDRREGRVAPASAQGLASTSPPARSKDREDTDSRIESYKRHAVAPQTPEPSEADGRELEHGKTKPDQNRGGAKAPYPDKAAGVETNPPEGLASIAKPSPQLPSRLQQMLREYQAKQERDDHER